MPRQVLSDSESEDERAAPAPPPAKPSRTSRDDLSGNMILDTRTRAVSSRKPSQKQAAQEKENDDTRAKKFEAMKKELHRARKKLAAVENQAPALSRNDDDDFESEEESFEEPQNGAFVSSSITPLGRLPVPPPSQTLPLRKTTKSNAMKDPKRISSTAFKNLPELPADQRSLNDITPPSSPTRVDQPFADNDDDEMGIDLPNRGTSTRTASGAAPPAHDKRPRTVSQVSPDDAPPPKRTKSKAPKPKEARFREGFVQQPGAKPAARDYEPIVEALLLRACSEYSVRILGLDGFPAPTLQYQWAEECFENACKTSKEHYQCSRRMIKLITKRGSQVRGKVVDSTFRPTFAVRYGFDSRTSEKVIEANKLNAKTLLTKAAFHYKDPVRRKGYGENSIIAAARKLHIFEDKTSYGAVFPSYLNPIPAPLMALEFTALEFLTKEWETGVQVKAQFTEKNNAATYQTHLQDINEKWINVNPAVTEKLRSKWYQRAAQGLVPAETERPTNIDEDDQEALRAELDGRTGDTDSEDEGDEDAVDRAGAAGDDAGGI
ncbi:hypothetical protein R3P38DRAFT_3611375 [Favolaschia claudopus]|uniref:DUF6532 domain-containing protein n=1 Tax=Favolaschia claudopus TaxID=2862362 RepID=A0AAW0A6A1_9AGAR